MLKFFPLNFKFVLCNLILFGIFGYLNRIGSLMYVQE